MDLVLDTSVVVKWFVLPPEDGLEAALEIRRRVVETELNLIVPDLIFYELANVLRYQPQLGVEEVASALDSLETMDLDVRPFSYPLGKEAVRLANATAITAYDAYFIVFAEAFECPIVTADRRCYARVRGRPSVKLLQAWDGTTG
jgi:predicted nucleic acid-binding protein